VALGAPALVIRQRERAVEGRDVVGGVVRDGDAVAIRVTGPVGHRLLADEVAAPEVRGVEAEPPRRAVEETVEHAGGLGAAGAAVRKCSRRVSIHFTGRPSRRATTAISTSSAYGWPLMPKPPPTSGASTRTRDSPSPSAAATAPRTE